MVQVVQQCPDCKVDLILTNRTYENKTYVITICPKCFKVDSATEQILKTTSSSTASDAESTTTPYAPYTIPYVPQDFGNYNYNYNISSTDGFIQVYRMKDALTLAKGLIRAGKVVTIECTISDYGKESYDVTWKDC